MGLRSYAKRDFRKYATAMQIAAAMRKRHRIETSGAITPTCHFRGSQLVDQTKMMLAYNR